MKKIIIAVLVGLVLFCLPLSAQTVDDLYREQLEASGGRELLESLPAETQELLEKLGITSLDPQEIAGHDISDVIAELWQLLLTASAEPLRTCGMIGGIVLLHAWMGGMSRTLGGEKNGTLFSMIATLAAAGIVMQPIASCISQTARATESLSIFMTSFVPVYAGILLSGGQALAAVSFQSVVLYVAQLLSVVSNHVIVPLMGVSLALGLVGAVTPEVRLNKVGDMIGKTATWVLTLGTMLFSGLLSIRNLAGTAVDTLGNRALRFSIASFVPVVGGSLSEAFNTVKGCLGMLKSTIGVFGIGAAIALVLPPLCGCVLWNLFLSLSAMSAELFELSALSSLLRSVKAVLKCLIGILCAGALFAFIAVTVVTLSTIS